MKPVKRDFHAVKLILAFLLSNFLFISFFILANSISYSNYQSISKDNSLIKDYILDLEKLSQEGSVSCDTENFIDSSRKLDFVGSKVSLLESRFGKEDERLIQQKTLYQELELKHYNLAKKMNDLCSKDFVFVLFFYNDNFQEESRLTGDILSFAKSEYPDRFMIYSFDYNFDSKEVSLIISNLSIGQTPVIIINDSDKISLNNFNQLSPYLE